MSVRPAIAGEPTPAVAENTRTEKPMTTASATQKSAPKGSNDQNAKPPASLTGDFVRRAKEFAQTQQLASPEQKLQRKLDVKTPSDSAEKSEPTAKPAARITTVAKAPPKINPVGSDASAEPIPVRRGFGRRIEGATQPAAMSSGVSPKSVAAAVTSKAEADTTRDEASPPNAKLKSANLRKVGSTKNATTDINSATAEPVAKAANMSAGSPGTEGEAARAAPRLVVSAPAPVAKPANINATVDLPMAKVDEPESVDPASTTSILMASGNTTDPAKLFPTTEEILRGASTDPETPKRKGFRFAEELAIFAAAFFVVCAGYIYWMLS